MLTENQIQQLVAQLATADEQEQAQIARRLVDMGEPAVKYLIESLDQEWSLVSAQILIRIGEPAVGLLAEAIKSRPHAVREQLAWILGRIGGAAARHALLRVLATDDGLVETVEDVLFTLLRLQANRRMSSTTA